MFHYCCLKLKIKVPFDEYFSRIKGNKIKLKINEKTHKNNFTYKLKFLSFT